MAAALSLFNLHTLAALAGLGMIAVGLWILHPAVCLVVIGGLMLLGAVAGQVGWLERKGSEE